MKRFVKVALSVAMLAGAATAMTAAATPADARVFVGFGVGPGYYGGGYYPRGGCDPYYYDCGYYGPAYYGGYYGPSFYYGGGGWGHGYRGGYHGGGGWHGGYHGGGGWHGGGHHR